MADFIITSLQSWDAPFGGNAKDIAFELSRQHRVLYVNSHSPKKGERGNLRKIQDQLWVLDCNLNFFPVNRLPNGILFNTINKYNNYKIFNIIKQHANQLQFQNIIHFCDNDVYRSFYARDFLQANIYIYYRRDNLHPVKYWSHHIAKMEPIIIQKSDIIMCNSAELTKYALTYKSPSFVYDIGQGVDLSAYRTDISYALPKDCENLPRPYIGYIGALTSSRLDIELLYHLAKERSNYTFLFVGKSDSIFMKHPLSTLPNVHFLGLKPMEQIPSYIQVMDVCLNPQAINEVTIGNYPRKVDEYLAMGKPIVATRTNTMEFFKDYVYLCSSLEEYLTAIDNAIINNSSEIQSNRIAFAHTHSWTHCIDKLYKAIKNYENTKSL